MRSSLVAFLISEAWLRINATSLPDIGSCHRRTHRGYPRFHGIERLELEAQLTLAAKGAGPFAIWINPAGTTTPAGHSLSERAGRRYPGDLDTCCLDTRSPDGKGDKHRAASTEDGEDTRRQNRMVKKCRFGANQWRRKAGDGESKRGQGRPGDADGREQDWNKEVGLTSSADCELCIIREGVPYCL